MINTLGKIANPAETFSSLQKDKTSQCVYLEFDHAQHYDTGDHLAIGVLCYLDEHSFRAALSSDIKSLRLAVAQQSSSSSARQDYDDLLVSLGLDEINLMEPMKLDRVHIPKPWGQEIWYTGIEKRGICSVQSVPLPWLLDTFGSLLSGTDSLTPILLKQLDPLPDEIYGDLYFELHEEKREVYVVTHVAKSAWPDSVGKIRYGFSQNKISEYDDPKAFRQAYLKAVRAYQKVRNKIDEILDDEKLKHQLDLDEPVPVSTLRRWQREIDPHLRQQEDSLRKAMNSFSALKDLHVGDVVAVHPHTPHSLQHGVRVIEFQTPHYERYILSFAQKVVTQDHWDTEKALAQVKFDRIDPSDPVNTLSTEGESIIADFEEFTASGILLKAGMEWTLNVETYCLVIGVQGSARIGSHTLQPEEGFYIPALSMPLTIFNDSRAATTFLMAKPGTASS